MTINGVEKSCIRSAVIVALLDVLVDAEVEHYETVEQFKDCISNKMDVLRKEIHAKK